MRQPRHTTVRWRQRWLIGRALSSIPNVSGALPRPQECSRRPITSTQCCLPPWPRPCDLLSGRPAARSKPSLLNSSMPEIASFATARTRQRPPRALYARTDRRMLQPRPQGKVSADAHRRKASENRYHRHNAKAHSDRKRSAQSRPLLATIPLVITDTPAISADENRTH